MHTRVNISTQTAKAHPFRDYDIKQQQNTILKHLAFPLKTSEYLQNIEWLPRPLVRYFKYNKKWKQLYVLRYIQYLSITF